MAPSEHEYWMQEAIRLALENVGSGIGGPFGALVVREGKLIAAGQNRVTATLDPTAHAEVVAIREACKALGSFQLDGCDLYASCEPCPMCLGAIYWARPSRVFYANTCHDAASIGFDDRFIYDELQRAHAERRIPMIQLLLPGRLRPFEAWAQDGDKQLY